MITDRIQKISEQAGMVLMTMAAITGMLDLQTHTDTRVVLPGQPSFALSNDYNELNDPIRREREDPAPHYASYSVTQRTHSRSANK